MSFAILQQDSRRAVSNLTKLSNEELDEIVNNDEKVETILQELDQTYLKEIENEKENLIATNNSMAEFNLSKEPVLVEGREKVQQMSEEGEQLTKVVKEKTDELRNKTGDMSLETALALLQTAASEMEEESDATAKKFLDSELEFDDFLDQFLTKRKIMHMRLVKAEKLSKILSRDPSLNNIPAYQNAPPVNINSAYFPGIPNNPLPYPNMSSNVPYPIGGYNMPMPYNNF